ncbi:hypothetical protein NDU88_000573 [Pleurodeles waltl]|uniref:Uncharacterized protein n=1 Tax=Pleurodeles waltl TaxID=8319 RepID=A0AAV7SWS9_PLEWA|nr:hypothetical protein NDU88_000573 [Pleurodeles waltl]
MQREARVMVESVTCAATPSVASDQQDSPVNTRMIQRKYEVLRHAVTLAVVQAEVHGAAPTLEQLGEALKDMAKVKCPGPDSLPVEYYQMNSTGMLPALVEVILEAKEAEELLLHMRKPL